MAEEQKHQGPYGKCPKCGWETRDLEFEEVELCKSGRLRCSGQCQNAAVPNAPQTFPPRLRLENAPKEEK